MAIQNIDAEDSVGEAAPTLPSVLEILCCPPPHAGEGAIISATPAAPIRNQPAAATLRSGVTTADGAASSAASGENAATRLRPPALAR